MRIFSETHFFLHYFLMSYIILSISTYMFLDCPYYSGTYFLNVLVLDNLQYSDPLIRIWNMYLSSIVAFITFIIVWTKRWLKSLLPFNFLCSLIFFSCMRSSTTSAFWLRTPPPPPLWILLNYPSSSNQFARHINIKIFINKTFLSSQLYLMAGYLSWIFFPLLEMFQKCVHYLILRLTIPHWNCQIISIMKPFNLVDWLLTFFVNHLLKLSIISNFFGKGHVYKLGLQSGDGLYYIPWILIY